MSDNIGPHLLGRVYIPDERDYRLEDFLGEGRSVTHADLVAQAVAELKQTTVGYVNHKWTTPPTGTHWANALGILAKIAPDPQPTPSGDVKWADDDPVLDQGSQGTCVGHGWAQWGNTLPIDDKFTHEDALDIYLGATTHDGQPDDPRKPGGGQQGASVRGGAQAVQDKGRLSAYAFTQDVVTIRKWVTTKGPVVFGSDWTNDMFNPDAGGYVKPTGPVAGGHCYSCIGDLVSEDAAWLVNSWGKGWALGGYFKMKWTDVAKLMAQYGEACTAVELPK